MKEAALARAEASTASKFVSKESEIESSESREEQETEVTNPNVCDTKEREDTPSRNTHTKKEDIANKGDTHTHTTPKREDSNLHAIKTEDTKNEKEPASSPHREIASLHPDAASSRPYSDVVYPQGTQPLGPAIEPGGSTLRDLIRLQQRQTELSAMIVNQQRMSALPVQEPTTFNGNLLDYPIFIQAFETIIESKVDADKDRLYFLNKFTTSKANEVVKGFVTLNTPDGYEQAKKLLARRFGNPHHVAEAYKSKLRKWPKIKDEDGSMIQEFSDFLVRCKKAMATLKYMDELNSAETLITISAKLPSYSGVKWCRYARELARRTERAVSFKDLVEFVREESELANDPIFSPNVLKKERNKVSPIKDPTNSRSSSRRAQGANTLLTSSANTVSSDRKTMKSSIQCPLCKRAHGLEDCKEFLEKNVEARVDFIRSSGLCFGCLRKGHRSKNCRTRLKCKECSKFHPTSIHDPSIRSEPANEPSSEHSRDPAITNCTNATETVTNSMILPVWLYHKDQPERSVQVYTLLDNASDTTFIKSSVLKNLGVEGPEMILKLYTMHGEADVPVQKIDGLVVESLDGTAPIELSKTYSRDNIPSRSNQIPTPETARQWPHLKNLEKEIAPYNCDMEVGILIGCNCPKALKPRNVILGKESDPYAVRTSLGWGIVGPVAPRKDTADEEIDMLTSNRILSNEVGNEEQVHSKIVATVETKEVLSPLDIRKVLESDFSESKDPKMVATSPEDRQFLAIVNEGIKHLPNRHYELPLPLKSEQENLPNNRDMALQRLKHLKRRMESDENYKRDYAAFMRKMIDQGHAEKIQDRDISTTKPTWYIPHHGVYHPKKQKIRVVFDCSAQYKGESLNKHLLQGPDLTNSLVGVLCRFRKESVAFICDIEGMFHQVQVTQEHRDLLRFLWWEDGDTRKTPQEYRMTVHLFGATSSPGCANFALKSTANDHESELGSAAADFLRNDFYVDDGLKSVATADEAIALIKNAREMCFKGGFNLHKFVSNDKQVIASIPESSRAEDSKTLDFNQDSLPIERALGVQWCVENDTFNFCILLSNRPTTRRGILSTVSSVFDPLGFVAPFILEGKKILQELCKDNVGWDEPVSETISTRWLKWRSSVQALSKFIVDRCYHPKDFGQIVTRELHHFSDASTKGYGQSTYFRLVNNKGDIHCSFVMGKARVTPLKPMTMPRLELTAALVSTRVSEQIKKELPLECHSETFWTDSKVVLGYVKNESRRFHIFVANRVQEIQEKTSPEQWRYVDTTSNPADIASRGISANRLLNSA